MLRNYLSLCCLLVSNALPLAAQEQPQIPAGKSPLPVELFEGIPPAVSQERAIADPKKPLAEGEDIGLGSVQDPFAELARKMRRSQQALQSSDPSASTLRLQQDILGDLDRLLEQAKKTCTGGSCQGGSCPKPGEGKPGSGESPSKAAGNTSAKAGTPPTKKASNQITADQDLNAVIRQVWGELPPKLREAMQATDREEYLPKYEQLIEDFYRRLATESRRE